MAFATVFAVTAAPAPAESLKERVAQLPPPAMTSSKSLRALEYCIGLGVSDLTSLSTIDGEGQVLIAGGPVTLGGMHPVILVRVRDAGDHRTVAFAANKSWDDRTEALIRSCL